jgi:Fungal domain of unknown function (DUF1750)
MLLPRSHAARNLLTLPFHTSRPCAYTLETRPASSVLRPLRPLLKYLTCTTKFQDATHEGPCGGNTVSTGREIIPLSLHWADQDIQLPHMHLVSKYRYPLINSITLDTVVGYLTEAPKIVHDLQPVQWQFLDAPQDGSVLLVWQPLEYLETNFASDGYVWADVEQAFSQEIRGYVSPFSYLTRHARLTG